MPPATDTTLLSTQINQKHLNIRLSAKTREKCADILQQRFTVLSNIQLVLSVMTSSGAITTVLDGHPAAPIATAIISAGLTLITLYIKHQDFPHKIAQHADAGTSLRSVRERLQNLKTDLDSGSIDIAEARRLRDLLEQETAGILRGLPRELSKAYQQASKEVASPLKP